MFFISDTHFHHANIIRLTNRPFSSVEEMNEFLIDKWNRKVKPNDVVYHLGDFSLSRDFGIVNSVFERLNGQKNLILGNHDNLKLMSSLAWSTIENYREISYRDKKIVLFHYPILEWNGAYRGGYSFHGHTHRNSPLEIMSDHVARHEDSRFTPYFNNWRNLAVELNDYEPKHIDELIG